MGGSECTALRPMRWSGWFAVRISGTEDVYEIYAESSRSQGHLHRIQREAPALVDGLVDKRWRLQLRLGRRRTRATYRRCTLVLDRLRCGLALGLS